MAVRFIGPLVTGSGGASGTATLGIGVAGATATVNPVSLIQFTGAAVSGGGTTATVAITGGSTEIVKAGAPNSDFDLTNGGAGGAVTILSESVAGIAAGDQIILDLWFSVFQNTGANRNYTFVTSLGAISDNTAPVATTIGSNATDRNGFHRTLCFSVSATNLTLVGLDMTGRTGSGAGSPNSLVTTVSPQGMNTSSSDITGNQTLSFTATSNATTSTQTLTLHAFTIRKIATV